MGSSDRTAAGWVLMAIALGAGWWYWHLLPAERRALTAGSIPQPSPSVQASPIGPLYDPHNQPLPPGYSGPPAGGPASAPFDAGVRLAGLFP